jgi:hypothetical protein
MDELNKASFKMPASDMHDALSDFASQIELYPPPEGVVRVKLNVEAYENDGSVTGTYVDEYDLSTKQLAQFIQAEILATAETITDTSNTTRAVAAAAAVSAPLIVAGTLTTAATNTDYKMGAQTATSSGSIAAVINAWGTASSTSGSFTVTGTITNTTGSTVNYAEVGIAVTCGGNSFLLSHDVFTALGVSNAGTLAVTYTLTFT